MFDSLFLFFFSSRRRHTRLTCDWSSDVCSSDLGETLADQPALPVTTVRVEAVTHYGPAVANDIGDDGDEAGRHFGEIDRSEERRVGKECRSRLSRDE